jgi:TetR/AcrR family transcriptional regulator, transcriptional repressor for nem operon
MGVSREQAARNRLAIIAAAGNLFRERGVDGVGLVELSRAAGFTQGGFYNHFKSKDDLVAAVVEQAMERGGAAFAARIEVAQARGSDPLEAAIDWYLSESHRADIDAGCPLSGFMGDIRRLGEGARKAYVTGLLENLSRFESIVKDSEGEPGENRAKAVALLSQMAGALLLSRAVVDVDPGLADEILRSARRQIGALTAPSAPTAMVVRRKTMRGH